MPPKIRELIGKLEKAGFIHRGDKGRHRNFLHPRGAKFTISGNPGDDALEYQEKEFRRAMREANKK